MDLNQQAQRLADEVAGDAKRLNVEVVPTAAGRLIDMGIAAAGGLEAGLALARICLAGKAEVSLAPARAHLPASLDVVVRTDQPVLACLASQYAGWQIHLGKFFAMGSGPMRAAAGREEIFDKIGYREQPSTAVGVLETGTLPTAEVFEYLSEKTQVPARDITLLVAPVTSLAGAIQIAARSVETALHKLHELKFDVRRIVSGFGVAPLPPAGGDMLLAMGRTNDAILYGGEVTLWVRGDDASLMSVGSQVPSSASADYGRPFREIFLQYDRDFYKIDPHLFSPAVVTLVNLDTGKSFRFGKTAPEVLAKSFT